MHRPTHEPARALGMDARRRPSRLPSRDGGRKNQETHMCIHLELRDQEHDAGVDPLVRQRAYHEAGHAAIEIIVLGEAGSRSLATTEATGGHCSYSVDPRLASGATATEIEAVIACLLAGFLTETMLC